MKRLVFAIAILSCVASGLHAKDDASGSQLLDAALKQIRPFFTTSGPYSLEADFTIQGDVPIRGHYALKFEQPNHWWRRVEIGGFAETQIRNGELIYKLRNLPNTPSRVADLINLMDIGGTIPPLVLDKVTKKRDYGIEETCLRTHMKEFDQVRQEFCIDQKSRDLLTYTRVIPQDSGMGQQFSEWFGFEGNRYPRKLDLFMGSTLAGSLNITSMVRAPFDPTLLIPPSGAIERRICDHMTPPVIVKQVSPDYGPRGSHPGVISRALISATVHPDGSVTDVGIAERGVEFMNAPALEAVKHFGIRPEKCGNEAVVSDLVIEMRFPSD